MTDYDSLEMDVDGYFFIDQLSEVLQETTINQGYEIPEEKEK